MSDKNYSAQYPPMRYLDMGENYGIIFFDKPIPIELISTSDIYTRLKPGAKGKATGWNKQPGNVYTLFVKWDNGDNLGLVYNEDVWKVIKQ